MGKSKKKTDKPIDDENDFPRRAAQEEPEEDEDDHLDDIIAQVAHPEAGVEGLMQQIVDTDERRALRKATEAARQIVVPTKGKPQVAKKHTGPQVAKKHTGPRNIKQVYLEKAKTAERQQKRRTWLRFSKEMADERRLVAKVKSLQGKRLSNEQIFETLVDQEPWTRNQLNKKKVSDNTASDTYSAYVYASVDQFVQGNIDKGESGQEDISYNALVEGISRAF